mmetsp:Transcript_181170/g.574851  ORF Transcript_181170/g.574851 Transcript_181170/m.574851 type:complete len:161 (-) Transcript_181170:106-588(-)
MVFTRSVAAVLWWRLLSHATAEVPPEEYSETCACALLGKCATARPEKRLNYSDDRLDYFPERQWWHWRKKPEYIEPVQVSESQALDKQDRMEPWTRPSVDVRSADTSRSSRQEWMADGNQTDRGTLRLGTIEHGPQLLRRTRPAGCESELRTASLYLAAL